MERNCQWEGTVGTLEKHMGVCEYSLVPCPKKCKQGNFITKRDLQQHLEKECLNKDYSCEHCGLKGTYATTLDHYDTCEKKIISCTNEGCTMEMERMKIKNHLSEECKHTVVPCQYTSIGCGVNLKRKDMRAHEQDDKAHLNKTVDTLVKLREKMAKLHNDYNMLREETAKLTKENNDRLVAKLVKMQAELSREKDDQQEDKVARSEVKMREETARSLKDKENKLNKAIDMNKTSLNRRMKYIVFAIVILLLAVGYPLYNHYQATVQQQVDDIKAIKFTMQQQNNDLRATKFSMQLQVDNVRAIKFTTQQQVDDLQANLRNLQATLQQQNDDLQETVEQQKDNIQATVQQHGSMIIELKYYREKMDNNVGYSYSLFYTSIGYKMIFRVEANSDGEDEGSHVSLSASIVKGEYDNNLNWPLVGYITFQLLNQLEDKNHHSKVLSITSQNNLTTDSGYLGFPQFYSIHSLLHDSNSTTQYLKNDTLYFRISVQASGHTPWLKCTTDMENEMGKKIVKVVEKSHVMTFKLPGYKKKKDNNEEFESPSFYTSPDGYHMKIEVDANGYRDNKGLYVSVYSWIIKGKNDNALDSPFVGLVKIVLLNQLTDEDHYVRYCEHDNIGSIPQYIPHSYLESNSPYLQNDTLYFRVSVDMFET